MPEAGAGGAALTIDRRGDGIAVVSWDEGSLRAASCGPECAEDELEAGLRDLERWPALAGLVFAFIGSEDGVSGSLLAELGDLRGAAEGAAIARRTQALAARIASLAVPSVGAVRGPCRGRSLAFVLATAARVASGDDRTRFALPEIHHGLVPVGGTTARLPRLVGVEAALDLLLSGREIGAAAALRCGLVDRLCAGEGLVEDALALVRGLPHEPPARRRRSPGFGIRFLRESLLARNPVGRALYFARQARRAQARSRGNYPAPRRLLDTVRGGLARGLAAGLELEAETFGALAAGAESRELVRLFAAREALGRVEAPATFRPVDAIGVLGAGATGAGIACVSAMQAGAEVRLAARDAASREWGMARLRAVLDAQVRHGRLSRARCDAVLSRVRPVIGSERLRDVALVVDAEPGSLEHKRRVIAGLEGFAEGRVVYASSLALHSVALLASSCPHPENVVGMRYSPPVERMLLLEVVAGEQSSSRAVAACAELGRRQGKTVIVVRDGPAFYCARILAPWFNEALRQLCEGVAIESIDWALTDFGFPVGPFARLDDLGLDVGAGVSRLLHDALGERMRPPAAMASLIADGRLGRRNGRGFYNYEIRRRERRGAVDGSIYPVVRAWPALTPPADEIAQRCTLAMINEAAHCLGEGIVRNARDGDVGATFGAGFPAFLGGPFRYVDALGAPYVVDRLEAWAVLQGERFRPAPLLSEMARRAGRFYPEEGRGPRPGSPGESVRPVG